MRRAAALLAVALALSSATAPARAGPAEDRAGLTELQAADARFQAIGWRLLTGNARFCAAHPAIGLLLQDMANYSEPARMRAAAGIAGDVAVEAVAPASPAFAAGLATNDEIVSIGGIEMAALPSAKAGDWRRLTGLHDAIDEALARDGSVRVGWRDAHGPHEATIAGVPACRTRFELLDSGTRASADGRRVVMGRRFAAFGYADDELAAAMAHELAHNLLSHRAWLSRNRRTIGHVRMTEKEADRLMPWLLANAGYDPAAGVRFFTHWGPGNDGWIFRARDHDGWDERADFVRAELPEISRLMASEHAADWRVHFRREFAR